jgi:hypothetical protein
MAAPISGVRLCKIFFDRVWQGLASAGIARATTVLRAFVVAA